MERDKNKCSKRVILLGPNTKYSLVDVVAIATFQATLDFEPSLWITIESNPTTTTKKDPVSSSSGERGEGFDSKGRDRSSSSDSTEDLLLDLPTPRENAVYEDFNYLNYETSRAILFVRLISLVKRNPPDVHISVLLTLVMFLNSGYWPVLYSDTRTIPAQLVKLVNDPMNAFVFVEKACF